MKHFYLLTFFVCLLLHGTLQAQEGEVRDTTWKKTYRASYPKDNEVVHTKLNVTFDFAKAYMYGNEWLTLKPHFYATDSVILDAKGMNINEVSIVNAAGSKVKLPYAYDSNMLRIKLDRVYKGSEPYTLYFDYVSKPNELKTKGSAAITDAKGLYFINPQGTEKGKPTQIWTQGETEANSVWMITIDKPNQKSTSEITMTVPSKFVTLSNGLLTSKKVNADGTRSDTWKMDLPHAPYLFFMGVGDYTIIQDKPYKGKEVSYYVLKNQAPYAKAVFGNTPEMMSFFSNILKVDFPWQKYSQIVGEDYVSGAMENTTATLHQASAYQDNRQLLDGNSWEETIAHELFHQWFGDLVTTESWSNLTLNESFANYSEYLWLEYKYGKDRADKHNYEDMQGYFGSNTESKDLVRFFYADKEDMFDAVSYNKGGRILHMLRNHVGDSAFFKALNLYLNARKFKSAEAHDLRLAFEEITGRDLNWYFNQWYYGSGHPVLDISYQYDDAKGKATVIVSQNQKSGKIFKLPVAVDVYNGPIKKRYQVWLQNKVDTLVFNYTKKPDLINVDADKVLLAKITDNKSEQNYITQWLYAPTWLDKKQALDYFGKKDLPQLADGLNSNYAGIQQQAIEKLNSATFKNADSVVKKVEQLARNAKDKKTQAAAIKFLGKKANNDGYLSLFEAASRDSSYSVSGAALDALNNLKPSAAYLSAKNVISSAKGGLLRTAFNIIMSKGDTTDAPVIINIFSNMPLTMEKYGLLQSVGAYLEKINDAALLRKGIDAFLDIRNEIPEQYRSQTDPMFLEILQKAAKNKGANIEAYVTEQMGK